MLGYPNARWLTRKEQSLKRADVRQGVRPEVGELETLPLVMRNGRTYFSMRSMISFRGMAQISFCETRFRSPHGIALAAVIDITWYATSSTCKRVLCAAKMIHGFSAALEEARKSSTRAKITNLAENDLGDLRFGCRAPQN
jgi:hypothetical protein